MIGSSYVSIGYTKVRVSKSVTLFVNKKIEIYLFSKQTVIGYDIQMKALKKKFRYAHLIYFLALRK